MTHKIVIIYQSLLGIYGDAGNGKVLAKRLQWRGEPAEVVTVEPGQPVPSDGLVYLLGGGEDWAQVAAVKALSATEGDGLRTGLDRGAVLLAVCAGYQLCGRSFTVGDDELVHPGLGLLDIETRRGNERAVGEVLSTGTLPDGSTTTITGFENYGGFTTLGSDATPFARIEIGVGNGTDGFDGAIQGRVLGTYPHGPLLPRNPELADGLLEWALGRKLEALPKQVVNAEHETLRAQRFQVVRTTKNRAEQTR